MTDDPKQTNDLGLGTSDVYIKHYKTCFHVLAAKLQDTRNPVAGGVVAVKDPNDQDILVAKLRIKLRLRYSIEELAEDYITRARVRQQDRRGKKNVPCSQVLPQLFASCRCVVWNAHES